MWFITEHLSLRQISSMALFFINLLFSNNLFCSFYRYHTHLVVVYLPYIQQEHNEVITEQLTSNQKSAQLEMCNMFV